MTEKGEEKMKGMQALGGVHKSSVSLPASGNADMGRLEESQRRPLRFN